LKPGGNIPNDNHFVNAPQGGCFQGNENGVPLKGSPTSGCFQMQTVSFHWSSQSIPICNGSKY
jgi:hypothetical protein